MKESIDILIQKITETEKKISILKKRSIPFDDISEDDVEHRIELIKISRRLLNYKRCLNNILNSGKYETSDELHLHEAYVSISASVYRDLIEMNEIRKRIDEKINKIKKNIYS